MHSNPKKKTTIIFLFKNKSDDGQTSFLIVCRIPGMCARKGRWERRGGRGWERQGREIHGYDYSNGQCTWMIMHTSREIWIPFTQSTSSALAMIYLWIQRAPFVHVPHLELCNTLHSICDCDGRTLNHCPLRSTIIFHLR